jgi:hypothetical protein
MARKLDPKSKAGFVRSLPASMSAADVVVAAKKKGLRLDVNYVYKVRGAKKAKTARKTAAAAKSAAVTKKTSVTDNGSVGNGRSGGLEAEIERIVERKVTELLRSKLGALFSA